VKDVDEIRAMKGAGGVQGTGTEFLPKVFH